MESLNKTIREIVASYIKGAFLNFYINPENLSQEIIQEKNNGGISYENVSSYYAGQYENSNKTLQAEVDPTGVFINLQSNTVSESENLCDELVTYFETKRTDTCWFKQEGPIVTMTRKTFIYGGKVGNFDGTCVKDDYEEEEYVVGYEVPTDFKFTNGLKDAKIISKEKRTIIDEEMSVKDSKTR